MITPHKQQHDDGRECTLNVYVTHSPEWFYRAGPYLRPCDREHDLDPISTDEWKGLQERYESRRGSD